MSQITLLYNGHIPLNGIPMGEANHCMRNQIILVIVWKWQKCPNSFVHDCLRNYNGEIGIYWGCFHAFLSLWLIHLGDLIQHRHGVS